MKLLITSTAEQDLRNIGDFIAQDNPARAVTFVRELQEQCQRLLVFPEAYRARPELGKKYAFYALSAVYGFLSS